ncbi:MAG: IS4 family transposase [Puniceicoccales bacterium]|jgi:hypothetical protein|nr:IS4 family transposase [Puniceicoccales bacterium]
MNHGKTILAQILDGLHPEQFQRCAERHPMMRETPTLSAYDHFGVMVFAQLTYRESLRDIEACLGSRPRLLYHCGIRGMVKRCNLAYANEHRPAALFAEIAMVLMRRARRLYAHTPAELNLDGELFAIDASLIELSLAIFPWARWQGTQAAVKLNVMLAVNTELPAFCTLTSGKRHDVNFLDDIVFIPGSYYVFDRSYFDSVRWHHIDQAGAWFVTRAKCNICFHVCESRKVDKSTGLRCDQTIRFNSAKARRGYPDKLRRIRYYDAENNLSLVFLTNNFTLPALVIARIYKRRWEIELFFRWIKQHLRLRGFFSTTPNGVAVQVWSAICAYLLVAIAKQRLHLSKSLHQVLQIISVSSLEKLPLRQLLDENYTTNRPINIGIQLEINGF